MELRSDRERLYWLIKLLNTRGIELDNFCNEFHITYDHDIDYATLSDLERKVFRELAYESARYSGSEEDHHNYPGVYSTSFVVLDKVRNAVNTLNIRE